VALACRDTTDLAAEGSSAAPTLDVGTGQGAVVVMFGAQTALPVTLRNAHGDTLRLPASFTLVSRNPAVVSVDSGTVVQGRAMGTTWLVGSVMVGGRTIVDSVAAVVVCTAELQIELTPGARTLVVGESFTPAVRLSSCGGRVTLTDSIRWSAADPTIVRVDSVSGLTTGLRAGQSAVYDRGARYGAMAGLLVTVTEGTH
jgi:hypothetical protein